MRPRNEEKPNLKIERCLINEEYLRLEGVMCQKSEGKNKNNINRQNFSKVKM